ncbi:MAG: peptidoglycan-binding protein [Planctomycetes bacterium]|nr:peptidoglycan-binding protein [Planctomycetota bacterium]
MPQDHRVRQGDCISSIAFKNGFFWETLWNHADNARLKRERQDPNVLMPGDVVHVPDLTTKQVDGATEQRHRFRLKGVPAKIKLRLAVNDEPLANMPYRLCLDDQWSAGVTDGEGCAEMPISPDARSGKILVDQDGHATVFTFDLGSLNPIDTEEGVWQRLSNMGYNVEPDLSGALRTYQQRQGLEPTGQLDEATRSKIKETFGQ